MAGSHGAATTAPSGRGDSVIGNMAAISDYRIVLPSLPCGEAMKRAVILHCDIAGRPYKIEDFRQPLNNAGVIQDVGTIGAYQMSHVWLLNMRSDEAKKKLLEAGQLIIKEKTCLVIDPVRHELRVKLHWVSFDVTSDAIRRAFAEFGVVKEVTSEKWRVPGFEHAESTTRLVRLVLRDGVTLDRIPHQLRLGGGNVLVVVPGRPPSCLRCYTTGHIRKDCRVPRCSECRAFGHVQADCTRSYARAVGKGTDGGDNNELLMDEEEAERAAASEATEVKAEVPRKAVAVAVESREPEELPKRASSVSAAQQEPVTKAIVKVGDPVPARGEDGPPSEKDQMDFDVAAAKRRHDEVSGASQEQQLSQLDKQWKTVGGRGKRVASKARSSSLTRGDGQAT
ncbi:uncharacterized protein ISCGN_016186 [Ixodes scapularis]